MESKITYSVGSHNTPSGLFHSISNVLETRSAKVLVSSPRVTTFSDVASFFDS